MGVETDGMITTDAAYKYNFANEGGVGARNRFLKNIMGLWLLQECQLQFSAQGMEYTFSEMDSAARGAAPFRSIINPDDPLFFQPGDMIGKIQSKCREWNQPFPETVGEITRCIQESLALTYRSTLEKLEEVTGFHIPSVHIIGGGARSDLLNQFAASAIRRPVFAGPYEAAALGNICAQMIAAGEMTGLDDARRVISSSVPMCEYLPEKDLSWDDAYETLNKILKKS
jgi:sugar (pentulose or hexulose) kinase